MKCEETRQEIAEDRTKYPKPGLALIDLQTSGWAPMDIDKELGCSELNSVDTKYASDEELIGLRNDFVQCAMDTYLNILERRKPETLEKKKPMPREVMLEFFEACNTKMGTSAFQKILDKHLQETGQMPNRLIIEAQRDLLEVLGFERDHGCACLNKIGTDHKDDAQIVSSFQMWQRKAKHTCMLAVQKHQTAKSGDTQVCQNSAAHQAAQLAVTKELQPVMEAAKQELESMSPAQRGEFLTKMQSRLEKFAPLPPEEKEKYVKELSPADKLEFAKAQILITSLAKQEFEARQRAAAASGSANAGTASSGPTGGGYSAPAAKPSQQMMMT